MITIQCIINLIFSRKFNLVNSPFQFMCFVEYLQNNTNDIKNKNIIYVGYCSKISKEQIIKINDEINTNNIKIFFLDEIFNINFFHLLLFFLKRFKRKFEFVVCGSINYYLFNEFVKKSIKSVILDEGIDILSQNYIKNIKKYNSKIYSCFPIKDKEIDYIKNDFSYLRKLKNKDTLIDKNLVYCLGTNIFESCLRLGYYERHLNNLNNFYNGKKIYYFPHRDEKKFQNFPQKFKIEKIELPIELYLLRNKVLPGVIAGFYSTALFTLNEILVDKKIDIININFDIDDLKWDDFHDLDKLKIFEDLLNHSGINKFYN